MATHSRILAWKKLRTEKPGELQSMESQRIGRNLVTEQQPAPGEGGENSFFFYPSRLSGWGLGNSNDVRQMNKRKTAY